ncbi:TPA: Holliday junction resolvase RecU [Clostridium perfringens]
MKNEGKKFEEDFKKSIPEKYFVYRFKAHNICDFEVFAEDKLFLFEIKSYKGASIPLSGIRKTQLEEMLKASNYKNIEPYFLLNFRWLEKVYAIRVRCTSIYKKGREKEYTS